MLAGDIVLFRSEGFIAKLIRWSTRDKDEAKTVVNHVGIMVSDTEIVESKSRTIRHPFANTPQCWIFRMQLSAGEREIVSIVANKYVGASYGWLKIVAHAADHLLFSDHYVARRLCRMDNYPICSWVVAYAYDAVGRRFGIPPNMATPDDIWDYVTTHPEWQEV